MSLLPSSFNLSRPRQPSRPARDVLEEVGRHDGEVVPSAELCDNRDNDCNGIIDDGASASCPSGLTCVIGACTATTKPNGATCTANTDCGSGFCVDGVCCNSACNGTCQACSQGMTGAADGACAPVHAGTDPHDDCADQSAASCGSMRSCNGTGACQLYPAGTVCAPA